MIVFMALGTHSYRLGQIHLKTVENPSYATMPMFFRVYTRVQLDFSAYAILMIKKYIKIPIFEAGLMVIPVIQPPQPVANCFQLIETTLREY